MVPAALVLLGLVAFLVSRAGGADGGILGIGGEDRPVPVLELRTVKAAAVPTTLTPAKELAGAAQQVATDVTTQMNGLYTAAFLDPGSWEGGAYDDVWALFDPGAQVSAQQSVGALTLGSAAGDVYEQVARPKGKVKVKVLTDADDRPVTAVAIVTFTAHATGKDGTLTEIVSNGEYFLRQEGAGWLIYSFSVGRKDHEEVPSVPASGPSGSATEVAS